MSLARLTSRVVASSTRTLPIASVAMPVRQFASEKKAAAAPAATTTTSRSSGMTLPLFTPDDRIGTSFSGAKGMYVNALFNAATKTNKIDVVAKDFSDFVAKVETTPLYKQAVSNPTLSAAQKLEMLKFQNLTYDKLTKSFIREVIQDGRAANLKDYLDAFRVLVSQHRKESNATVYTAQELKGADRTRVEKLLPKFLEGDRKLAVSYVIKPSLVGGLVVELDGKRFDMSLESILSRFQGALKMQGYNMYAPAEELSPALQRVADYVAKNQFKQA